MNEWPDEAREAVMRAIASCSEDPVGHALELDDPALYKEQADAVLAAVAPYVTPTAPLRDLADGWDGLADIANPGYSEILRRAANKLREVIDRA